MKLIVLSCYLFLAVTSSFGQNAPAQVIADSSKIKAEKLAKKHFRHRKFIQAADTLSKSDYLMSIDRVNDKLIDIRDSSKLGYEIVNIKHRIDNISNDFIRMQKNFPKKHIQLSVKNLILYKNFASELDNKNDEIIDRLQKLYLRVYHAKLRVKTVLKDSVFRRIYADSLLRNAFDYKLALLERKWAGTDSISKLNIDSINSLKIKAIDNSINLTNLMNRLNRKLENANKNLFGQELPNLWKSFSEDIPTNIVSLQLSEQKAVEFYVIQTWGQRIFIFACGLLLFLWLFMKRKLLGTIKQQKDKYEFLNLKYLVSYPVLSILLVFLSLMPFFDAFAPTAYIAFEYLLVLVSVTIIFFKNTNQRTLRFDWLALTVLFIAVVITYLIAIPSAATRLWMIILQLLVILFTYRYSQKTIKTAPFSKWIKIAAVIGIILSLVAILSNIFGRFTLSYFIGTAAIVVITQVVVLSIFIDAVLEIILIQLLSSRQKKKIYIPFDVTVVTSKITMPVIIVAVLLWLIMVTSYLNIYHVTSDFLTETLTVTRTIGSISFKLFSLLLFFGIIWFAHVLQRLLSFLFGEIGTETDETAIVTKGQHSRLLITRLLVLIGGYLLAIAASGLPIDKLTFLLGALGVGIGMGLQNIVNNFVSGIILIFDGSLQIGDEIEVSGQAGKVKEIGLRASTINTSDGAEVIIPNGNILSQNIINWTYSNDQKRATIEFSLKGTELDANEMNEIINDTIKNIPYVIVSRKPVILYTKVTSEGCTMSVRFWTTISKIEPVKSNVLLQLNTAFSAKNIGFY